MQKEEIAFLGIGIMGTPMCKRLSLNGYHVTVWNRTRSKAEELAKNANNIKVVETAKEAMEAAKVVIMMLWDAKAVHTTLALLDASQMKGRTFINMNTIAPNESSSLDALVSGHGGIWIEAPVLGTGVVAEQGALKVMVGCKPEQFEAHKAIFSCFGTPYYLGAVGAATSTKIANNFILGANVAAFAESYAYLERSKVVDMSTFVDIITTGPFNLAGGYFSRWAEKFKNRDYSAVAFPATGIDKDVHLALKEMERTCIHSGAAAGIYNTIHHAVENFDIGEKDFAAIYEGVNPRT